MFHRVQVGERKGVFNVIHLFHANAMYKVTNGLSATNLERNGESRQTGEHPFQKHTAAFENAEPKTAIQTGNIVKLGKRGRQHHPREPLTVIVEILFNTSKESFHFPTAIAKDGLVVLGERNVYVIAGFIFERQKCNVVENAQTNRL
ncbi:hypothetical protein AGDE_14866 [Angomonas deanei]|nr:hypothetical protein AGDE_14866 [Angomonas deanei]|eukprot:EPY20086.1 hypothetical protein AGDE_14866 [Angomonas deanei]